MWFCNHWRIPSTFEASLPTTALKGLNHRQHLDSRINYIVAKKRIPQSSLQFDYFHLLGLLVDEFAKPNLLDLISKHIKKNFNSGLFMHETLSLFIDTLYN